MSIVHPLLSCEVIMYSKSSKQCCFAPYTQQRPIADRATLQAKVQRLQNLKVQLDNHNTEGNIVTYDDAVGEWVDWQRPVKVMKSGAMTDVAASGFHTLGTTPSVLARQETGLDYDLTFSKDVRHQQKVVVPRLNPPLVTQDYEVIAEQLGPNDGSWCESGGDSGYSTPEDPNAEDSDIEELSLSISFRPTLLTSTPPRRPRRPQEPSRRPLEAERTLLEHLPRRPLEAQRTLGTLTANALPSRIWDSPWTPPEYNGTEFNLTNFKATVYTEATVAPTERLYISGTSFIEGKEALKDAMDMAISRND
ncbi:hypothetical protein H0H93_010706 [Arthromyces matolae]|nr:hypothetical protein H0H93_010706 [Arthromyces matolae]